MEFQLNPAVLKAIELLKASGHQGYLVGGALRDLLLNETPKDLDLTTDATKEEILEIFKDYKCVDVGTIFGTVLVVINHVHLEITPHRSEDNYLDHRHPTSIKFIKDIKEDLARRDFTINALAYNLELGLIDYYSGQEDLNNKVIRSVGNPNLRFNEDALRILRAIRFSLTLNFKIEETTKTSIFNNKDLLNYISIERKMNELKKILSFNVYPFINEYLDVFKTFVKVKETDLKIDKFSSWLLKLTYILNSIDSLNELKLANNEVKLIKTLFNSKTLNFDDDYIFVKTLSETNFKDELLEYKAVLDDKDYSNKYNILKSRIIESLNINGYDLLSLGFKDEQIKTIQNKLKEEIYLGNLLNEKDVLLEYLKKQYN